MNDLLDDLIGGPPPPPPPPIKRTKAPLNLVAEPRGSRRTGVKPVVDKGKNKRDVNAMSLARGDFERTLEGATIGDSLPRFEAFWKPVGISFLANVFKLSNSVEARKKLAECPPIDIDDHGNPLYDFVEAAAHLVPPRGKLFVQRLRNMKPSELPPQLALAVQKAKNEELTYKTRAGELWRTEAVLDVLGEVFLLMKTTMELWVETLNDKGNLSKEQYEALTEMVYGLQTEMHDKLVEFSQNRATYAVIADDDVYESAEE